MQLLIAANGTDASLTELLRTFKFRNEVKVLGDLPVDELAELMAAAYAFVYPVFIESFSALPLEAMQCKVPVICSQTGTLAELCGEAAIHVNPADFNDIADKMMLLFKDESRRNELIKAGKIRAGQFSWDNTTHHLWQVLSQTTK